MTATPTKVRCVTYKDDFSAHGCSFNDLLIGARHTVVGCNSNVFGSSKPGDLVIITANRGKRKFFTIGVLTERLYECTLWADAGGRVWEHNFVYHPLLDGLYERTPAINARVSELCAQLLINPTYVFHSRFCGERYAPVLRTLVAELKTVVPSQPINSAAPAHSSGTP
jgi:hypothetical protein